MGKNRIKNLSKTDWKRIDNLRDEDIDFSDIPEADEAFFKQANVYFPQRKVRINYPI